MIPTQVPSGLCPTVVVLFESLAFTPDLFKRVLREQKLILKITFGSECKAEYVKSEHVVRGPDCIVRALRFLLLLNSNVF